MYVTAEEVVSYTLTNEPINQCRYATKHELGKNRALIASNDMNVFISSYAS